MSRASRMLFWVIIGGSGLCTGVGRPVLADEQYSAEELSEAEDEKKDRIASIQRSLQAAKTRFSVAVRTRNTVVARAAREEVENLERELREVRQRDVTKFADARRIEAKRVEAEEKAERQAQQARERARLEIMSRPKIQPSTMKKGDQGFFQNDEGNEYLLKVLFISDVGGIVSMVYGEGETVVVSGVDSDSLITGRWYSVRQQMKVVGQQQFLKDGSEVSLFVISPLNAAEKTVTLRAEPQQPLPPLSTRKAPRTFP